MSYGYNSHAYHTGIEDAYPQVTYQPDSSLYIPTFNNNNPYGDQWTPEYRDEHAVQHNDYGTYSPIERAQPPPEIFVHPNSAVAQLGLTQEEIREVLEDQERWMREEYAVEEQGIQAPTATSHYQQDGTSPSPTPIVQYPPPSLDHDMYNVMDAHNEHAAMLEGDERDTNEYGEPDHDAMIERLALEPIASGDTGRNWADEVEN